MTTPPTRVLPSAVCSSRPAVCFPLALEPPRPNGARPAAGSPVAFPDHPSLIPVRLSSFAPVRLVRRGAPTGPTFAVLAPARGDQGGDDSDGDGGNDHEQRG